MASVCSTYRRQYTFGLRRIDEKDITINSKRGLQLGGQWINCETNRRTDGIARVRIKEALTIPGNSEIVISGKGENREDISTKCSVLEPTVEDKRKVMVARSLVDSLWRKYTSKIDKLR